MSTSRHPQSAPDSSLGRLPSSRTTRREDGALRRLDRRHVAPTRGRSARNADDTPVALAGWSREVGGSRRNGPVDTVEPHRRRGYGAAVTAVACRRALDRGTTQLLLYADIENATSNALYRRLGFEPVEDRPTVRFQARV